MGRGGGGKREKGGFEGGAVRGLNGEGEKRGEVEGMGASDDSQRFRTCVALTARA